MHQLQRIKTRFSLFTRTRGEKVPLLPQLACAFCEQHRNSVHDGIAPRASGADDLFRIQTQNLMTDRADEAAEIFWRQWALGHVSMLCHNARQNCDTIAMLLR